MWNAFLRAAEENPDWPAISRESLVWSYSELLSKVSALASLIGRGDRAARIAVALPSGPEFLATQMACFRAGAIFIPLARNATIREYSSFREVLPWDLVLCEEEHVAVRLRAAGADCFSTFSEFQRQGIRPLKGSHLELPEDARMLQFTSGSTGRPKGILISSENIDVSLQQSAEFFASFRGKAAFSPLPQFHAMGNAVALEHVCNGSPMHFGNGSNLRKHVDRFEELSCEILVGSPDYVWLLGELEYLAANQLRGLEHVVLGSDATSRELFAAIQRVHPQVSVHLRYGLSEAVGSLAMLSFAPGEPMRISGEVGQALPGVELRVMEGQLQVRAKSCATYSLSGERGLQPQLDSDGYLSTFDEAAINKDGAFVLRGRRDAIIKVHGHRVDPREIEMLIRVLPEIAAVVVFGVPTREGSPELVCCIEPRDKSKPLPIAMLESHCREQLAPFKRPSQFHRLTSMPRTLTGKLDRVAALDEYLATSRAH